MPHAFSISRSIFVVKLHFGGSCSVGGCKVSLIQTSDIFCSSRHFLISADSFSEICQEKKLDTLIGNLNRVYKRNDHNICNTNKNMYLSSSHALPRILLEAFWWNRPAFFRPGSNIRFLFRSRSQVRKLRSK